MILKILNIRISGSVHYFFVLVYLDNILVQMLMVYLYLNSILLQKLNDRLLTIISFKLGVILAVFRWYMLHIYRMILLMEIMVSVKLNHLIWSHLLFS